MFSKSSRAARILEIKGNSVKVELFSMRLPVECEAKGCTICKTRESKIERNYTRDHFAPDIKVGDIVRIESRLLSEGMAAAILFLTPVIFASAFYYFSGRIFDTDRESALSIFLAVVGGVIGFVLVAIFDKVFSKLNPPEISNAHAPDVA